MRALFINSIESGYSPTQCGKTLTINELIELLENCKGWYGTGDLPIYLYNDNRYTYGEISEINVNIGIYNDSDGAEFE